MYKKLILIITLALTLSLPVEAAVTNPHPLYNPSRSLGSYLIEMEPVSFEQSTNDNKTDKILLLEQAISENLGIVTMPSISYIYEVDEPFFGFTDFQNSKIIINSAKASTAPAVVETLAHELRHWYQNEHINDQTEYGQQVRDNYNDYVNALTEDFNSYNSQFVETDARGYAYTVVRLYNELLASNTAVVPNLHKDPVTSQTRLTSNYLRRY